MIKQRLIRRAADVYTDAEVDEIVKNFALNDTLSGNIGYASAWLKFQDACLQFMNERIVSYDELSATAKRIADADENYLANVKDLGEEDVNTRAQFTVDGRFISEDTDDVNEVWFIMYYFSSDLTKLKARYLYGKLARYTNDEIDKIIEDFALNNTLDDKIGHTSSWLAFQDACLRFMNEHIDEHLTDDTNEVGFMLQFYPNELTKFKTRFLYNRFSPT